MATTDAEYFSIIFVCSGNRFRSPLAEGFVRSLTQGLPVVVGSFGTLEIGSVPPLEEAEHIAEACGVDLSRHRTRHLGSQSLADTDLLLGFEKEHARSAVVDAGVRADRAFMLREIVSLLGGDQVHRTGDIVADGRLAVRTAAERRAALSQESKIEPIRDPFGGSWRLHKSVAAEVRDLSIALVDGLFGVKENNALPPFPRDLARPRSTARRL